MATDNIIVNGLVQADAQGTAARIRATQSGGVYTLVVSNPSGGDVVGPASSTDNAIARFDGATGKLLQNSTVTLSDTGLLGCPAGAVATPAIAPSANPDTGISFVGGNMQLNTEGVQVLQCRGGDSIDIAAFVNFNAGFLCGLPNVLLTTVQIAKTITAGGTTGAQTINKQAGSVNFAALATSLVVTDNQVTADSVIIATVATNDSTMKSVQAVAGAGSFTLFANAAATAETRVNFLIFN